MTGNQKQEENLKAELEWKSQTQKTKYYMVSLYVKSTKVKPVEADTETEVVTSWGEGKLGRY